MLTELSARFHHIGVACRDLDAETAVWIGLGYRVEGADFEDPLQRVRGRFVIGAGPRLELLVGTSDDSAATRMVRRGVKYYHQAFTVPDLAHAAGKLRERRGKMIVGPTPAVAFGGRPIAFFVMPNLDMIELIEAP